MAPNSPEVHSFFLKKYLKSAPTANAGRMDPLRCCRRALLLLKMEKFSAAEAAIKLVLDEFPDIGGLIDEANPISGVDQPAALQVPIECSIECLIECSIECWIECWIE